MSGCIILITVSCLPAGSCELVRKETGHWSLSSSKYLGTEQSGRVSDVRWSLSLECETGFQSLEIYARHREQHGKETCVGIMLGKGQQASFAVASGSLLQLWTQI